jgi:predicted restriction endonuclease
MKKLAGLARRGRKGYQAIMNKRGGSDYWLHKLATLRIDRARGNPAPHKPFLLLVVLEMAEREEIKGPELPMSADLAYRFSLLNR